jgi:hypothetical protein
MERGIRQRGRRERQSNGLRARERESDHWIEMVLAWVRNDH